MTRYADALGAIGVTDADDDQLRLQKRLLVSSSAMMTLAAVGWGLTYLALGRTWAAIIPLGYSALNAVGIAMFAWLKRYRLFRMTQLALSLLLPVLLGLSLGGLVGSSGVVLWSLTCPFGALVFAGYREARWWFLAFCVALAASLLLDASVTEHATLSETTIEWFVVLNIAGVSVVAFVLM